MSTLKYFEILHNLLKYFEHIGWSPLETSAKDLWFSFFCQSSVQTGWRLFGGRSRREGELWSVWVDGVLSSSSLSPNSSSFLVLKNVIIKIIINTIIIVIIAFWRTTSLWSKATLSLQLWVICTLYKKVQTGVSLSIQSQTSSNPSKRFATI